MSRVGAEVFRNYFADWAGHNCANMDYLTREQVNQNIGEGDNWGLPQNPKWKILERKKEKRKRKNYIAVRARPVGGDPRWGLVSVQAISVASS